MVNKYYEICLEENLFKSMCEFLSMYNLQHSFNTASHDSEGGRRAEDYVNTANDAGEELLICKVNTAACEGTRVP